jgi:hypothetical protein
MDWNSGYGKLIAMGLTLLAISGVWWAWAVFQENTASGAKGGFTGAVLILLVGGVLMIRDRKQSQ